MLSNSFLLLNKNPKNSIFRFLLLHPWRNFQNPNLKFPSFHSFSTLPPPPASLSPQNSPDIGYKLNHKDWLSPNEVIKIFENLKDPNSTISVWNQYTRRKDYKPNEAIYTIVIHQLSLAKNFDAIEDIMQRIKLEKSCRISNEFFYNVIKIYGHSAGRTKKAVETLLDMPKGFNCWPNVKTFNLVLNLLVSAKLFGDVHEIYLQAPMLGVEIDACCLNILIKGLCENGDLKSAFYVFDEFPKQRCKPNVRTFSTLMHYLCVKGEVEEAFGLLEKMEIEGIDVDTITFNILISGLRKRGRVAEGMELLMKMKLKGCEPNEASYQEILYGLLELGKFVDAKEFMSVMLCKGMNPSLLSYKKLIRGLCKANLIGDVDLVLKQMVKQGFVPKMGMWKLVTRSLFSGTGASNICLTQITGA
ncbi:pentatricopeptide repeat-containing protein At3g14580, mitochondrial [Euphorbia lathyris]|uniref:pentatricopeptide repeat-containing protein At3g14580, mitochondrial n=1 Tax=Euphorbia lathyris TaxID=212925 RepID=UPI003314266B